MKNITLKNLLKEFGIFSNIENIVQGITCDSRKIKQGYIFVAQKGYNFDGQNFIDDAIKNGAICIITNRDFNQNKNDLKKYEKVIVNNLDEFTAKLAIFLFDNPSKKLNLIGVTGTNGKTTTTYILESIYKAFGQKTGIIGTIQNKINEEIIESKNTTPLTIELQNILHEMNLKKINSCFMEVSSHALVLDRIFGCDFNGAIFTNLTEDHLDFHINMNNYCLTKQKLFNILKSGSIAIINADDKYNGKIISKINKNVKIIKFSIKSKIYDVYAKNIKFDKINLLANFDIVFNQKDIININSYLIGKHNIYNILGAASLAYNQNIPTSIIKSGIENLKNVPGRFEFIREKQDFVCIIDYAHTDNALYRTLKTCKNLKLNNIITIFGCGGDRDRKKRPLMAEKAAKYSNFIFITNDNPRNEDPQKIALDIELGFKKINFSSYKIILNRETAIKEAIFMAQKNDILLIAGKGHENYQIFGNTKIPYSDKETVINIIRNLKNQKELF